MAEYYDSEVEYYKSTKELIEEDDIIETDVKISGWRKKLRIRALTIAQMEEINKDSIIDGVLDQNKFVLATIRQGVVRPKFSKHDVEAMAEKNGALVQELSEAIWDIGRVDKKVFDEYIAAREESDKQNSQK